MWCRYFVATIVVLAALIGAAGCGSDADDGGSSANATAANGNSSSDGSSGSDATKSDFVDQANALCKKRQAELKTKNERVFSEVYSKPEEIAAKELIDKVVIPIFEDELRDLESLSIPPEDNRQVTAIYKAIDDMIIELKADPTARGFYPYTKAEKLAKQYGLTECGHP